MQGVVVRRHARVRHALVLPHAARRLAIPSRRVKRGHLVPSEHSERLSDADADATGTERARDGGKRGETIERLGLYENVVSRLKEVCQTDTWYNRQTPEPCTNNHLVCSPSPAHLSVRSPCLVDNLICRVALGVVIRDKDRRPASSIGSRVEAIGRRTHGAIAWAIHSDEHPCE